jgi:cell division protein FtsL
MASRRVASGAARGPRPVRGRTVVAAVLVAFVLLATGIIWRRGYGIARAVEIREMDRHRVQLEAERVALERQIAELAGRAHLQPLVERRLNMRVPDDSQVILLAAPAPVLPAADPNGSH